MTTQTTTNVAAVPRLDRESVTEVAAPSPAIVYGLSRRAAEWWSLLVLAAGIACLLGTSPLRHGQLVWGEGMEHLLASRSLVVDGNLRLQNERTLVDRRHRVWAAATTTDRPHSLARMPALSAPRAAMGIALAPFYALGFALEHIVADATGRSPSSLGWWPQAGFALGVGLYVLLGVWATVALGACLAGGDARGSLQWIGALLLASPLVYYAWVSPALTHAVAFGLAAAFVFLWWRAWEEGLPPFDWANRLGLGRALARGLGLGAILGLATALEPSAFWLLLPLAALWVREMRHGILQAVQVGLVMAFGLVAGFLPELVAGRGFEGLVSDLGFRQVGAWDWRGVPAVLASPAGGLFYWGPLLAVAALGLIASTFWLPRSGWLLAALALQVTWLGCVSGERLFDGGFGVRHCVAWLPILAVGLAFLVSRTRWLPWREVLVLAVVWNLLLVGARITGHLPGGQAAAYGDMTRAVSQMVEPMAQALGRLPHASGGVANLLDLIIGWSR